MNFGVVVFAWVLWIIAHGAIEGVQKPAHIQMSAAVTWALVAELYKGAGGLTRK